MLVRMDAVGAVRADICPLPRRSAEGATKRRLVDHVTSLPHPGGLRVAEAVPAERRERLSRGAAVDTDGCDAGDGYSVMERLERARSMNTVRQAALPARTMRSPAGRSLPPPPSDSSASGIPAVPLHRRTSRTAPCDGECPCVLSVVVPFAAPAGGGPQGGTWRRSRLPASTDPTT